MPNIIVHFNKLPPLTIDSICDALDAEVISHSDHYKLKCGFNPESITIQDLRSKYEVDINVVPEDFDPNGTRFLISDMDSTLIAIECIDEIADFLNIKDKVSVITEAAMRGEIDFNTSLTRRVGLLKGLDAHVLQKVYDERLRLNPGGENLIVELQKRKILIALVSGGFTFFTERLKQRFALDFTLANTLDIVDNKLTGKVLGEIVNADVKADFLQRICAELDISSANAIAVGDGANDLKMLSLAGLSVAYRAKPKVQAQADVALNYSGLDSILHFME